MEDVKVSQQPPMSTLDRLAVLNRKLADVELDPTMFGQICDSLPNGLIVIDESAIVHLVNVQVELMFGYHRSRLVGESVHMLLAPELADRHARHLTAFFAEPVARPMNLSRSLAGRHSSGRVVLVQISIGPLITEAGIFGLAIVRRAGAGDGG